MYDSGIHSRHVAPANIFNLSSTRELNGEKKEFLSRPPRESWPDFE